MLLALPTNTVAWGSYPGCAPTLYTCPLASCGSPPPALFQFTVHGLSTPSLRWVWKLHIVPGAAAQAILGKVPSEAITGH